MWSFHSPSWQGSSDELSFFSHDITRDINQNIVFGLAVSFSHSSSPHFSVPSSFLLLFPLQKGVGGVAPTRPEVLIAANRRKPNVRSERLIFSPLSISSLFLPLSTSLYFVNQLGLVKGFNLREQRIPWQPSTVTDGRRAESRLRSWSSGMSRKFLGLVSHRILCFSLNLIREAV